MQVVAKAAVGQVVLVVPVVVVMQIVLDPSILVEAVVVATQAVQVVAV